MPTESEDLGLNNPPDRLQVSLYQFPIQNDRAGYRPFSMPLLLVAPHRRTKAGDEIQDSLPYELVYSVEDVQQQVPVAGVENRGILIPDFERFRIAVSTPELLEKIVNFNSVDFFRLESDGSFSRIDFDDAVEGDYFEYTLSTGVRGRVIYYPDADYFDLSGFAIGTVELPDGRYRFVWSAKYNRRLAIAEQFVCMSNTEAITTFGMNVACPGEVHSAMVNNTPEMYFNNETKGFDDQDVVKAYRPLADAIQDIFDEQTLLRSINWIDRIPAQLVPYLAYLIGLDLPNFPGVSDKVRIAMLKNGVKLQRLKGTKRALRELFEIFGFSVDLINTWYLSSGTGFVAPGESLPQESSIDEIAVEDMCHYDILLNDYDIEGFGDLEIPLLYRPKSQNITLHAYLVEEGSATHDVLKNMADGLSSNLELLNSSFCPSDSEGFYIPTSIDTELPNEQIEGFGQVLINRSVGPSKEFSIGVDTISKNSTSYQDDNSVVLLNFDGYKDFVQPTTGKSLKLFVFAQYIREKITIPTHLIDKRSNRFDIDIMFKSGENITSNLFDFLIGFVFKFKAFHSLIRKIRFNADFCEIYNVIDFCAGGQYDQEPGTDAGELQVPPAIIPTDPDSCADSVDRGFKDEDLAFRQKVLDGLKEEFENWKAIDKSVPDEQRPLLEALSNVLIPPNSAGCGEVDKGQDRVLAEDFDQDHEEDTRDTLCNLENNSDPYCYKGRVKDLLIDEKIIKLVEYVGCNPCHLSMGTGRYYTLPGGTKFDKLDLNIASILHKAIKDWKRNDGVAQLYFSNRKYLKEIMEAFLMPAIQRPSVSIQLPIMHFPGHRFAMMNALVADFTHPTYRARPWDDYYASPQAECKTESQLESNPLNAEIIEITEGIETLVFDDAPLIYAGNGITPDISSLSEHDVRDYQITHAIYTTVEPSPFVDLDLLDYIVQGSLETEKLFESWNPSCGQDYIDGYPSQINEFEFAPDDFGFDGYWDITSEELELPISESTNVELLFRLGSGILCLESSEVVGQQL